MVRDVDRPARRWLLLAVLAAALLVPGTPLLQSLAPVGSMGLLVVPAVAACAVVGWTAGGRGWLAGVWVALAVALLVWTQIPGSTYGLLERGWVVMLVSLFGLVCITSAGSTPFFPRALAALAATTMLASILVIGTPGALRTLVQAARVELAGRPNAALDWVRQVVDTPSPGGAAGPTAPVGESAVSVGRTLEGVLRSLPEDAMPVFPALLALESLAALALAWELFHYISRTRVGEPLGALRDFRFSDQLAWGLIVGLTLVVLPTAAPWRLVGLNVVLFFGALYAVRGLGVLVWFLQTRRASAPVIVALAVTASLLSAPTALGLGLVGLGDSWLDWRRSPVTPTSHPAR